MFCTICNKEICYCTCDDIQERLMALSKCQFLDSKTMIEIPLKKRAEIKKQSKDDISLEE